MEGRHACFYCGRTLRKAEEIGDDPHHPERITFDHLIPKSRGCSSKDLTNLVEACRSCNSSKGRKTLEEYREYLSDKFGQVLIYSDLKDRSRDWLFVFDNRIELNG